MPSEASQSSPLLNAILVTVVICLPILLIGIGLLFSKGIKKLNENPKAYKYAGAILGLLYVPLFVLSILEHRGLVPSICFLLCAITWPICGVQQGRSKEKQLKAQGTEKQ
jgi:hypothetical protein